MRLSTGRTPVAVGRPSAQRLLVVAGETDRAGSPGNPQQVVVDGVAIMDIVTRRAFDFAIEEEQVVDCSAVTAARTQEGPVHATPRPV